uniref:Transposase n=1 Tax=Panagrellus redivivus TaxID=6233 RepID=A0A7E4W618_PANRE
MDLPDGMLGATMAPGSLFDSAQVDVIFQTWLTGMPTGCAYCSVSAGSISRGVRFGQPEKLNGTSLDNIVSVTFRIEHARSPGLTRWVRPEVVLTRKDRLRCALKRLSSPANRRWQQLGMRAQTSMTSIRAADISPAGLSTA